MRAEVGEQEAVEEQAQQGGHAALHPAARRVGDNAGERPEEDVVGVVDELARAAAALLARALGGGGRVGRVDAGDAVALLRRRAAEVIDGEQQEAHRDEEAQDDRDDAQWTFQHGSKVRAQWGRVDV